MQTVDNLTRIQLFGSQGSVDAGTHSRAPLEMLSRL